MSNQDGRVFARNVAANIAVAGFLAVGTAVAFSATAYADDPPPPADPGADPTAPPPVGPTIPVLGAPLGPQGFSILAQAGQPAVEPLGTPALPELNRENLLGQNPVPMAPGGPPGVAPNLDAMNSQYLLRQNEVPAAPGQGTAVGPATDDEHLGRVDYLKQLHALYSNGNLKGSLLGRVDQTQLGEPLPGTAPLPGTNIPPGLVQNLPDPAAPADPSAPPVLPVAPVPPPVG